MQAAAESDVVPDSEAAPDDDVQETAERAETETP
jgi:hypothetical protein